MHAGIGSRHYGQMASEIPAEEVRGAGHTVGTPCPDFSVIMDRSAGTPLPKGSKFVEFADNGQAAEPILWEKMDSWSQRMWS